MCFIAVSNSCINIRIHVPIHISVFFQSSINVTSHVPLCQRTNEPRRVRTSVHPSAHTSAHTSTVQQHVIYVRKHVTIHDSCTYPLSAHAPPTASVFRRASERASERELSSPMSAEDAFLYASRLSSRPIPAHAHEAGRRFRLTCPIIHFRIC